MGRRERDKGARGERELAAVLTAAGFPATRGRQHHGGADAPDVRCDHLPGLHLESKRCERLSVYAALAQAAEDAGDRVPVVCHRRNGREWVAILRLEDLLDLIKASGGRSSDSPKGRGAATVSNLRDVSDVSPSPDPLWPAEVAP